MLYIYISIYSYLQIQIYVCIHLYGHLQMAYWLSFLTSIVPLKQLKISHTFSVSPYLLHLRKQRTLRSRPVVLRLSSHIVLTHKAIIATLWRGDVLAEGDGDCNIYFHSFLAGSGSSFRTDPREVYISRSGDEQVRWQSIWLYSFFFFF